MKIKQLHPEAILPMYATSGASAFDVFAYEPVEWQYNHFGWTAVIKTGLAFEIPQETGLFILSRSGQGFNYNTHLSNCVGLLDFDFTGELRVKLLCFNSTPPPIVAELAIAQCVLLHTPRQTFELVEELTKTERGSNAYGSTDKK